MSAFMTVAVTPLIWGLSKDGTPWPPSTRLCSCLQAHADALAAELDASRAQAAQADSEAAETEAAFHMLQAEARPCRVGFGLRSRTGALSA